MDKLERTADHPVFGSLEQVTSMSFADIVAQLYSCIEQFYSHGVDLQNQDKSAVIEMTIRLTIT
jgi:hypothetical protein